jgi:hypothetical protein
MQEKPMDRARFVTHREHRILVLDATGCSAAELATLADLVPEVITREPLGSLLVLTDFTGAEFSRDAVDHMKIAAALDRPHIKRAAWVGAQKMPKALFDSIRNFSARDFPVFESREQAMDYLVS